MKRFTEEVVFLGLVVVIGEVVLFYYGNSGWPMLLLYGLLFGAVAAVPVAVVSKLAARWANPPAPAPNPRVLPGEPTMTLSERRGAIAYALACFAEMCRRHAR